MSISVLDRPTRPDAEPHLRTPSTRVRRGTPPQAAEPRVRAYLDVDGVLSPMHQHQPSPYTDWRDSEGTFWSPSMIRDFDAVDVDVSWLTTHLDQANLILAPLFGWSPRPVLPRTRERIWWKIDVLSVTHPPHEPFIWIDDEIDARRQALHGTLETILSRLSCPQLLVSPDPHVGLTPDHFSEMDEFVQRYAQR